LVSVKTPWIGRSQAIIGQEQCTNLKIKRNLSLMATMTHDEWHNGVTLGKFWLPFMIHSEHMPIPAEQKPEIQDNDYQYPKDHADYCLESRQFPYC
jgi:hypothetical protein